MQPSEPTSWLLNGQIGWRTAKAKYVTVGEVTGIRLATDPAGPLALSASDGSLGGLSLPRGMAIDDQGLLYLLGLEEPWIKRFDPAVRRFVPLPLVGGAGWHPRQFDSPRNIASAGRNLYVADTGNRRVQVFDRTRLSLRYVWQIEEPWRLDDPADQLALAGDALVFVAEPSDLAMRLGHALDPLAAYLVEQLAPETREFVDRYVTDQTIRDLVKRYAAGQATDEEVQRLSKQELELRRHLTRDLDARIRRGEPLHTEERFRKVRLSVETKKLIAQSPQGDALIRLHMRLLEEAFPGVIATRLWEPVDVAAGGNAAYILDRRYGRVYRQRAGKNALRRVVANVEAAGRWSRVVADRQGDIYLLDSAAGALDIYDQHGDYKGKALGQQPGPPDVTYTLDRFAGRVYRRRPGTDVPELVIDRPDYASRWREVFWDQQETIYLPLKATSSVDVYDPQGRPKDTFQGQIVDLGAVRDRFDAPAIRLDHKARFCLPASLARLCDRRAASDPPLPEKPLALCPPPQAPAAGSPLLKPDDVAELGGLAIRLRRRSDPVAQYLYGRLSPDTLRQLEQYQRGAKPSAELVWALLDDLNCLLQSGALADEPAFQRLHVSDELRALIDQQPHGATLIRLNRALLEAAFPGAFKRPAATAAQLLIFNQAGEIVDVDRAERAGKYVYARGGYWFSKALDSQIYGCQWHRIELELLDLPVGTQVIVSTFADARPLDDGEVSQFDDHLWETRYAITGPAQPPASPDKSHLTSEFLVQSRAGQYLWLKIALKGDGYATPAVGSIRVHYPRRSYVDYLPAVYSADDESRWFLERFLAVFQTEWNTLEQTVADIAAFFDPLAVPVDERGDFLAYLASWLALPLEGEWSTEQRRRLLAAAPRIYPHRGQAEGLADYVRIYLQNITGISPDDQRPYPRIVEGFRERQRALLVPRGLAELDYGAPIWGPGQVGRLQLDVYAREGDIRLVSTGDPQRDLFHEYAHRFRVFMPAAWVRTTGDERMLRRALDAEKPAHTHYDLCLVEPRMRVGIQSIVGIDTIIGGYPFARLARPGDDDQAIGREPRNRLGYDTILAGRTTGAGGFPIAAHTRVGIDTLLT
jgi:phage tail-like protein